MSNYVFHSQRGLTLFVNEDACHKPGLWLVGLDETIGKCAGSIRIEAVQLMPVSDRTNLRISPLRLFMPTSNGAGPVYHDLNSALEWIAERNLTAREEQP